MSGDEILVLLLGLICGFIAWKNWLEACVSVADFRRTRPLRNLALLTPFVALALLFFVLKTYASADVRTSELYLLFYLVSGFAWLALIMGLSGLCGFSFRDDWLERRNPAAAAAGPGILLGGISAFAGANIGDGPGWWVVLFSALLSTGVLFLGWFLYDRASGAMEQITLERDWSSGLRLGAFLFALGIAAGRAVAGNWNGAGPALADFIGFAPILLAYAFVAGLIERRQAGRGARPSLSMAILWILVHFGALTLFLFWAGPW